MTDDEKVKIEDVDDEETVTIESDNENSSDEEQETIAEPAIPEWDPKNAVSLDTGPQQSKKNITIRLNSAVKEAN